MLSFYRFLSSNRHQNRHQNFSGQWPGFWILKNISGTKQEKTGVPIFDALFGTCKWCQDKGAIL